MQLSFGLLPNAVKQYYRCAKYKIHFPFSLIAIVGETIGSSHIKYCMKILYKQIIIFYVRFSVFITINMQITVFWNVTSGCLVERYSTTVSCMPATPPQR
jgi:hypothetical protein